jgi:hypothetical protein
MHIWIGMLPGLRRGVPSRPKVMRVPLGYVERSGTGQPSTSLAAIRRWEGLTAPVISCSEPLSL